MRPFQPRTQLATHEVTNQPEPRLTGHKWFCSAPMSDAFLTLAYAEGGATYGAAELALDARAVVEGARLAR